MFIVQLKLNLFQGTSGFEKHIDHLMKLSALFKEEVEKRDGFKLVTNPCFINVCFWFIPSTLRIQNSIYDYEKRLHEVSLINYLCFNYNIYLFKYNNIFIKNKI